MNEIINIEAWRQVIISSFVELGRTVAGFLPNLVGMLVILGVGWAIAKLVEIVFRRLFHRAGLDRATQRLGVQETLGRAGISRGPSELIARGFFWVLMLTFVLSAFETLGLTAVTGTIDRLIVYLPSVIAAALVVIIGLLLARFLGNLVSSGTAAAGFVYARQLGAGAHGVAVLMVSILAFEQLGLDTGILVTVVTAVIAAVGVGLSLAFALGSRDVVRAILAGHYVRQSLPEGQPVEIDGQRGILERVGPTDTLFRGENFSWSVPNAQLLETIVKRSPGLKA
jgi:hypothetical protein